MTLIMRWDWNNSTKQWRAEVELSRNVATSSCRSSYVPLVGFTQRFIRHVNLRINVLYGRDKKEGLRGGNLITECSSVASFKSKKNCKLGRKCGKPKLALWWNLSFYGKLAKNVNYVYSMSRKSFLLFFFIGGSLLSLIRRQSLIFWERILQ